MYPPTPRPGLCLAGALLALLGPATGARAAEFPPITAEERALAQVPGHPGAPAVVLYRKGDLHLLDLSRQEQSSTLTVEVRLKILTEEGKEEYGEIAVLHSPYLRLKKVEGRTVLPDGREVPLSEESVFKRQSSRSRRLFSTTTAFPALEVGAILDYRYQIKFDDIFYLEPWVFQQEIPVLSSEIVYHLPDAISARLSTRDPLRVGIRQETTRTSLGRQIRAWGSNLPPILDEPFGLPEEDLAARFMLVPTEYVGVRTLLDTWATTCGIVEEYIYGPARHNNGNARRRARELAGSGSPRDQALALLRFVRDQIETDPWPGVMVDAEGGPDKVLAARKGDSADKAMLLAALLDAVKIDARLVWAASRWDGLIDQDVPSYSWFDRVLVQAKIGAETVYLDASERSLGFGQLAADYEGTTALVYDKKKPELITLPVSPFEANSRQATIELALGEEGRLRGKGSVVVGGHHASRHIAAGLGGDGAEKAWRDWLVEHWPGFQVDEIEVQEAVDERKVEVRFRLEQAEEDVLGDEVSLKPSRPLGPVRQALTLPPEERRSPVLFDFADRDEVDLALSWPEGWRVETRPEPRQHESQAGDFVTSWQVDEAARTLRFRRRMDVKSVQFMSRSDYAAIRGLYDQTEKSDVQDLVLVRD